MAFRVPEQHRITADIGIKMKQVFNVHPAIVDNWVNENKKVGNRVTGNFMLPRPGKKGGLFIFARASAKDKWEHVAVSIPSENRCPTWEEMSFVKEQFWNDDNDIVFQFHPAKKDENSGSQYCLNLWRRKWKKIETPKPVLVGERKKTFDFLNKFIQAFKKKKPKNDNKNITAV